MTDNENKTNEQNEKQEVRPVRIEMDAPHIRPTYLNYIPDTPETEPAPDRREVLPEEQDIYSDHDKTSVLIEVLDWIRYILIAVIVGLLLSYFVIQRSAVVGSSMEPSLLNQDQLLVEKVSPHFTLPARGAIVTVDSNFLPNYRHNEMLVKRVIARPGDTIDFVDGKVYINNEELDETYLPEDTYTMAPADWEGPLTLDEDHVYVLGDNRAYSADSRIFGPVPRDSIVGHVLIRIYPFARFGIPR